MNQTYITSTALITVSVSTLFMAYVAQFGFGLEPCILCLFQRLPYAMVAVLGFFGLMRPQWLGTILVLAAVLFITGAFIAAYHVGVEQHWWVSATGCSGDASKTFTTQDVMKSMQTRPAKACDAVDWTFLSISMAGWNVFFSSLFAGASLYARRRLKEH